jgi:hypothetical protein
MRMYTVMTIVLSLGFFVSCEKMKTQNLQPVQSPVVKKFDTKKVITKSVAISEDTTKSEETAKDSIKSEIESEKPEVQKTQVHNENKDVLSAKLPIPVLPDLVSQTKKEESKKEESASQSPPPQNRSIYFKVKNVKGLNEISNSEKTVIFGTQVVNEDLAVYKLKNGNEDSYCSMRGDIVFDENSVVDFKDMKTELKNIDADVYESILTVSSNNKQSKFICSHTTNQFYIEQLAVNFSKYIEIFSPENKKFENKEFINPRAEARKLNALKIKNKAKLIEVSTDKDPKALAAGAVVSDSESLALIQSGKERTACVVSEIPSQINTDKVYFLVRKKLVSNTNPDLIEQHILFRADKDNYFSLMCMMTKKTSQLDDIISVTRGVLEFGALNRLEYNAQFKEVLSLQIEIERQTK